MDEIKSETKQIKFPIAAVFVTLVAVFQLINKLMSARMYAYLMRPIAVFMQLLPVIAYILLAVALFVRKSKGLLVTALSLNTFFSVLNTYTYFDSLRINRLWGSLYYLGTLALYLCEAVIMALLLVFAIVSFKKETKSAKTCGKTWFIPGILSIFYMLANFLLFLAGPGGQMLPALLQIAAALLKVPMIFLLGWWLTHPYKKPEQQYYAPVQDGYIPNGGYQPVNTQDVPSGSMNALSFFFPMVGLILYLVWKDQMPLKAKAAGKFALIGFIVWTVLSILLTVLGAVIPMLILFG